MKASVTTSRFRLDSEEVTQAVLHDLNTNTRTCSPKEFLESVLASPANTNWSQVYDALADWGWVKTENGQAVWKGFPTKPGSPENEYYAPVASAANAIIYHASQRMLEKPQLRSYWIDKHTKAPVSTQSQNVSDNRPDLNCFLVPSDIVPSDLDQIDNFDPQTLGTVVEEQGSQDPSARVAEASEDASASGFDNDFAPDSEDDDAPVAPPRKRPREAGEGGQKGGGADEAGDEGVVSQESLKEVIAYWMRTLTIMEIKPTSSAADALKPDTALQSTKYMREMLREQHDRRFVFGIILCHNQLSLQYCDRSGLLQTSSLIDINKEPLSFIRVIASLALCRPEQLGWDLTMKMGVVNPDGTVPSRYEPSWSPQLKLSEIPPSSKSLHWQVEINGKRFRTIESLSVARAEVMCGRASIVWLATPEDKPEPVVIKQSWPPVNSSSEDDICSEGDMYKSAGPSPNLPEVRENWVVPGTNTLADFRKGLVGKDHRHPFSRLKTKTKIKGQPGQFDEAMPARPDPARFTTTDGFTVRQQNRLVLNGFGWSIKYFKDLKELLDVLLGAINGYEHLYSKGVCHRDVSISNILIEFRTFMGRMIDLDHAKKVKSPCKTLEEMMKDKDAEHGYSSLVQMVANLHGSVFPKVPRPEEELLTLVILCLHLKDDFASDKVPEVFDVIQELDALWASSNIDPDKQCVTLADLGLSPNTLFPPMFYLRKAAQIFRTGTLAFMSYHILDPAWTRRNIPHSAIHDMESFFWVLLYTCITRSGPGGKRQDNIPSKKLNATQEARLNQVLAMCYYFFDGDATTMWENKAELLEAGEQDLKEFLFPLFAPYFEPLKGLLLDWIRILKASAKCATIQTFPIPLFKKSLEKALASVRTQPATQDEKIALAKREATIAHIDATCVALINTTNTGPATPPRPFDQSLDLSPLKGDTSDLYRGPYKEGSARLEERPAKRHAGIEAGTDF